MSGKIIITISIIFTCCIFTMKAGSQERPEDGVSVQKLYGYIEEYLKMIPPEMDSLKAACDHIIAFSRDTIIRSGIAGYLFNRFMESPIMGYEEVAIYIAKNYFLNGMLKWSGDGGMIPLKMFVEFNEKSLLGMDAPELILSDVYGIDHSLRDLDGNYTILYFFDEECPVCKEVFPGLQDLVKEKQYLGMDVFAIYTQHNAKQFEAFVSGMSASPNWHFVMDRDNTSDFHRLYNVLKTPQIFLLDGKKKIIGRNLDLPALSRLLELEQEKIEKLHEETEILMGTYLPLFRIKDSIELEKAIDPLFNLMRTQGDEMRYNILFYHLFEYFAHSEDEYAPEAAVYIAEKYIIPYDSLWRDRPFYEERVPLLMERVKTNRIGSIINDVVLYKPNGNKVGLRSIKSRKYTYLYFFSPNCAICEPFGYEIEKIYKKLKNKRVKVTAIYTGEDQEELSAYLVSHKIPWDILWVGDSGSALDLYYKFEIDKVPQTYLLDEKKRIIAKRINTIQLQKILE